MSDLISRQDAINLLKKWADGYSYIEHETELAINAFEQLPSAQLEPKRGKWIKMMGMMPPEYFGHYECSECGWHLSHHDKTKENELGFCPNCGARMNEVSECLLK